ncbi:hypothetical protein SAMN04488574_10124 [Bacillus sp. 71mf]|nr:hypothetical protein SAMN04488574_10124 [Bacillus sp. 71mf]SFS95202.1 hypothetical protein SAMN04488145_105266 [Bacillus sp. 103mf]
MTIFSELNFIVSDHANIQFLARSRERLGLRSNKDIEEHLLKAYVALETESHIYFITENFRFPCKKEDNSYIVKSALTKQQLMKPYN